MEEGIMYISLNRYKHFDIVSANLQRVFPIGAVLNEIFKTISSSMFFVHASSVIWTEMHIFQNIKLFIIFATFATLKIVHNVTSSAL